MVHSGGLRKRAVLLALSGLLAGGMAPAVQSQVSVGIDLGFAIPGARIGLNLGSFPHLVAIPGYPVYYAPRLDANLFFYDGLYWVFADDGWYSSEWYNGPWDAVAPEYVPVFLLRIPLQYYRRLPRSFRGWDRNRPPRWEEHWGRDWSNRRRGWDRPERSAPPPPRAPLPLYQRQYGRDRYPAPEQQRDLRERNYRYQPREQVPRKPPERSERER